MQTDESSEVLAHVSRNVRRLRLDAGLSQAALADASGVSRRTVIKLEAGEANISLTGLDRLAESLGVTFVDLVAEPSAPRSSINEVVWRGQHPGSVATLMASVPANKEAQLLSWCLEPTERYVGEPDPAGWSEMILVLEGELLIKTTEETVLRSAGEHYAFATSQDFSYINESRQVTRFARIVVS
ncbi:XRE family transcriptional regulator [Arthrobacter sp. S41]|nr:XRE family transcriptional regulator [Arthrobacter sp. S41]